MQGSALDASLRDPQSRLAHDTSVMFAGLHDPNQTQEFTFEELERLRIRKRCEFQLILRVDKKKLDNSKSKECWYLMDASWLNKWGSFVDFERQVRGEDIVDTRREEADERKELLDQSMYDAPGIVNDEDNEEPGPISSAGLHDKSGKLLQNLKVKIDYRAVSAVAFFAFQELYGTDKTPTLPRWLPDIYKPAVQSADLVEIQMKANQEAKILVNNLRPKWIDWTLPEEDDDDYLDNKKVICCGLTKEHLEAFIYWAVRCCLKGGRRNDGRAEIKYTDYNPMRYKPGDSTHGLDSSHGSNWGGSTRGGSMDSSRGSMDYSTRMDDSVRGMDWSQKSSLNYSASRARIIEMHHRDNASGIAYDVDREHQEAGGILTPYLKVLGWI